MVGMAGILLTGAVALILGAFNQNLVFFHTPTEVFEGAAPSGQAFRMGGLVVEGSLQRQGDGLTARFDITDTVHVIPVIYRGVLPDLFREGQGAVVQGVLAENGLFRASEVLARHDENYMPKEARYAIDEADDGHAGSLP